MNLEIDERAAEAFNGQASHLLTSLVSTPRPTDHVDPDKIDLHVAARVQILEEISMSRANELGEEEARFFGDGTMLVGLADEGFKNLIRLSEAMQRAVKPRNTVSVECLSELIFDWVKGKYFGRELPDMAGYVLPECERRVEESDILIPISSLRIQSSFTVGRVTFTTLTSQVMDGWLAQFVSQQPEHADVSEEVVTKWRREMQGYAAAMVKVEAEPKRASQVAFEETEKALSVLRFFTRANFHPKLVSSCAPLGSLTENRRKYFQLRGGELVNFHRSKPINDWVLGDADLAECREKGLDILSGLLLKEKLTSFQKEVLQAVFIYSKNSTAHDVAEKLIYVLVAIESMFVRDKKENLQANIGERMAFFAGETTGERPKIKNNVVRIYDIRSSFLHHGEPVGIDKLEDIREFMVTAWRCLQGLVQLAANDSTSKEKVFKILEARKWAT